MIQIKFICQHIASDEKDEHDASNEKDEHDASYDLKSPEIASDNGAGQKS